MFITPRHLLPLFTLLFSRDTVNSVGLIPHSLPFTTSNTVVCTFRHAIALDERRAKFKANLWNRPEEHEEFLSISDQKIAQENANKGKSNGYHNEDRRMLEGMYAKSRANPTDIDEVTIILSTLAFLKIDACFFFLPLKGLVYWMPLW